MFVDTFSRWVEAYPTGQKVSEVVKALLREIIP